VETLPENLIARTHLSRCLDANACSGGLLSQLSVRAEDWNGNDREQHNSSVVVFLVMCSTLANKRSNPSFMQQQTKMNSQAHEEITVIIARPLPVTYETDNSIVRY
jgi:hypothetical protein